MGTFDKLLDLYMGFANCVFPSQCLPYQSRVDRLTCVVGCLVVVSLLRTPGCSATSSHQLLALDDEEFYDKQKPLALDGVRQLAGFLKNWLCR